MTTQTPNSLTEYKIFSININHIVETLVENWLYLNDLNTVPVDQTSQLIASLLQLTLDDIHVTKNYHPFPTPVDFQNYYWNEKLNKGEFVTITSKGFNSRLARMFYTSETLELIRTELMYELLLTVHGLTTHAYYEHPVYLKLPNSHILMVGVHESDLRNLNESYLCHGSCE